MPVQCRMAHSSPADVVLVPHLHSAPPSACVLIARHATSFLVPHSPLGINRRPAGPRFVAAAHTNIMVDVAAMYSNE
jgi:hypothetical protein